MTLTEAGLAEALFGCQSACDRLNIGAGACFDSLGDIITRYWRRPRSGYEWAVKIEDLHSAVRDLEERQEKIRTLLDRLKNRVIDI